MCVPVQVCTCECMLVEAKKGHWVLWGLGAGMSHPMGVLGAELRSSARVVVLVTSEPSV